MAKLSGKGQGKWSSEERFKKYKRKRSTKNKMATKSRRKNARNS